MEQALVHSQGHANLRLILKLILTFTLLSVFIQDGYCGPREESFRIFNRLTGTAPSEAQLQLMTNKIIAMDYQGAVDIAINTKNFYNVFLKNHFSPWTTMEETLRTPLNDTSATLIGIVRDDIAFDQSFYGDILYTAAPGVVESPYSLSNNTHYEQLQSSDVDLSDSSKFIRLAQSEVQDNPIPTNKIAGIFTTRQSGETFLKDGTNRRMVYLYVRHAWCETMEGLKDITGPNDYIRRDVTRSPGSDPDTFLNECSGCHTFMDPQIQAFIHFDWDSETNQIIYDGTKVAEKYTINAGRYGYDSETDNKFVDKDTWLNFSTKGQNSRLGFSKNDYPSTGVGPKAWGQEVSSARAFYTCQVEKVWSSVCLRKPSAKVEREEVARIADLFQQTKNYKDIVREVSWTCLKDM